MLSYHSIRQFNKAILIYKTVTGTALIPEEPAGKKQYSGVEMTLCYIKISKYVHFPTRGGRP